MWLEFIFSWVTLLCFIVMTIFGLVGIYNTDFAGERTAALFIFLAGAAMVVGCFFYLPLW